MNTSIDHTSLHRTAKYFMDNGRAATHQAAMALAAAVRPDDHGRAGHGTSTDAARSRC